MLSYFYYPTTTGFISAYAAAHGVAAGVGIYYFFSNVRDDDYINSNIQQWFKYGFPISIWLSLQASIPFIERSFVIRYDPDKGQTQKHDNYFFDSKGEKIIEV